MGFCPANYCWETATLKMLGASRRRGPCVFHCVRADTFANLKSFSCYIGVPLCSVLTDLRHFSSIGDQELLSKTRPKNSELQNGKQHFRHKPVASRLPSNCLKMRPCLDYLLYILQVTFYCPGAAKRRTSNFRPSRDDPRNDSRDDPRTFSRGSSSS